MLTNSFKTPKLAPKLHFQANMRQKRSSTLFRKPNRTVNIINKFRKDAAVSQEKKCLFSLNTDIDARKRSKDSNKRKSSANPTSFYYNSEFKVNYRKRTSDIAKNCSYTGNKKMNKERSGISGGSKASQSNKGLLIVATSQLMNPKYLDTNYTDVDSQYDFGSNKKINTPASSVIKYETKRCPLKVIGQDKLPFALSFHKVDEYESIDLCENENCDPTNAKSQPTNRRACNFAKKTSFKFTDNTKKAVNVLNTKYSNQRPKKTTIPSYNQRSVQEFTMHKKSRKMHKPEAGLSKASFKTRIKQLVNKK